MPQTTPAWSSRATSALTEAGFPQVFNPFENESTAQVPRPTGDSVTRPRPAPPSWSTVKIEGAAGAEGREGSGFVHVAQRVMTNAHVVAGIDDPERADRRGGAVVPGTGGANRPGPGCGGAVAVLRCARCCGSSPAPARGDAAVVAGYPHDGALDLRRRRSGAGCGRPGPERFRQHRTVTREIYSARSTRSGRGNSGARC
ncbi:hypothetical protein LT493_41580 [Streptomyces tricolor]|nr:hypothetical protein [Streptomyces tricolor]